MPHNKLKLRFILLQTFYWTMYGSFASFLISFVTNTRNASGTTAGLIFAIFMVGACVGQYVLGSICDRFQNNRTVFAAGAALVTVIQFALYFSPSLVLIGIWSFLLGMIEPPIGAVMDTWIIRSLAENSGEYSSIRRFGSLFYAFLLLALGFVIEKLGYIVMPLLSCVLAACAIATALSTPEIPRLSGSTGEKNARVNFTLPIILFILTMALMGTGNMPILNMNILILQSLGGSVSSMGIATCCNAMAEFFTMSCSKYIMKLPAKTQLYLSIILYILSTFAMVFANSVIPIYIGTAVNGIAYGIFLPARRKIVTDIAPANTLNRLHGLGDLAYLNFGGLVGNQLSGMLIDSLGSRIMLATCTGIQVIGLISAFAFIRSMKKAK